MRTIFLGLPVLLLAGAVAGENVADIYREAQKAFEIKDYKRSYELLTQAFKEKPDDPEINFALGRAAFECGDYEAAAMAFERMLIMNPDLPRVKLELGRCYYNLKAYDQARKHFEDVLASKPPENVRQNIQNFLDQMKARDKRNTFNGDLSGGFSYDTNVRVAPDHEMIRVPNGPDLRLNPESYPRDDTSYWTLLSLRHKYKFPRSDWAWKTSGAIFDQFYTTETDLDVIFTSIQTGPALELGNFYWEVQGTLNYLERDYQVYMKSWGLRTSGIVACNQHLSLAFGLEHRNREMYWNANQDARDLVWYAGPVVKWGKNQMRAFLEFGNEDAASEIYSLDRVAVRLRYDRALPWRMSGYAGYQYEDSDYQGTQPLFNIQRYDNLHRFTVGLRKQITSSVSAGVEYDYRISFSNIDLYDYDRHVVGFQIGYSF